MVIDRALRAALAAALLSSWGCGDSEPAPRTQIMLVVDSDLSVPHELDSIVMHVDGPGGVDHEATAQLGGEEPELPRSLALVHEQGPLSPLHVRVEGRRAGALVLAREARLAFVAGRTLVLPMHLVRSCVEVECGEQTCTEHGCRAPEIDPTALSAWSGEEPALSSSFAPDAAADGNGADGDGADGNGADGNGADGSGADGHDGGSAPSGGEDAGSGQHDGGGGGDACVPADEICNSADDDCDGVADDGIDLQSDENHCGACNNRCGGATRTCCAGVCMRSCN